MGMQITSKCDPPDWGICVCAAGLRTFFAVLRQTPALSGARRGNGRQGPAFSGPVPTGGHGWERLESMLNIVLVNPEIPQNTGNIARTCAVTGTRLHLVHPLGFAISDRQLKRAGLDYWNLLDIREYESLDDFFEKNRGGSFYYSTTKARQSHCDVQYRDGDYLLFGRETRGLPEPLLKAQDPARLIRIPMLEDSRARSINLASSVAIVTFEALRQLGFPGLSVNGHFHEPD